MNVAVVLVWQLTVVFLIVIATLMLIVLVFVRILAVIVPAVNEFIDALLELED